MRKCQVSIFVKAPRVQFSAIQVNTLKNNFCPEASSNGACQSEINFLTRTARAYKWNQRLATSDHPCPSLLCSANGDFTGDISPIQSGKIAAVKREKEQKRLRTDAILNLLNMACNADEKRTLATSHTLIESRIDMRTRHRDGKSLSSKSKQGHQFLQEYYCCQLNGCANKAAHSHFINI